MCQRSIATFYSWIPSPLKHSYSIFIIHSFNSHHHTEHKMYFIIHTFIKSYFSINISNCNISKGRDEFRTQEMNCAYSLERIWSTGKKRKASFKAIHFFFLQSFSFFHNNKSVKWSVNSTYLYLFIVIFLYFLYWNPSVIIIVERFIYSFLFFLNWDYQLKNYCILYIKLKMIPILETGKYIEFEPIE